MDRHSRQSKLVEVGATGQARIARAVVDVGLDGLAGLVAVGYLAGAGVGSVRVREGRQGEVARAVDARVQGEVVALADECDASAFDLARPRGARRRPGLPPGASSDSSCARKDLVRTTRSRRIESVVDAVGNTPLLRLRRVARGAPDVEVWAKLEFANPGGSVKDRPALRMMLDALASGRLTPDKTLIDLRLAATPGSPTLSLVPRWEFASGW